MKYKYGLADEEFIRGNVPMTKAEIRAMVMVRAAIEPAMRVLDIGAGTGSLTIEAALQAHDGQVYAVERNPEGVALIHRNAEKFGLDNITVVEGRAPEALADLPQMDVIMIGGSGGELPQILTECERLLRPGGRIVATAVTVETAHRLAAECRERGYMYEGFQMQVNRLQKAGPYHLLQPLSPIYILTAMPKGEE